MDNEFGFTSHHSAQDIIGFFHYNISQHTKEIAVINTTLADITKNKIDSNFKSNVLEFMEHTETRVERLSTSFKLLTKQVFHNDASLQKMINSSIEKVSQQTDSETIEEIKNNQKEILERLSALENSKQKPTCELTNSSMILIYDSPPEPKKKSLNVNKVVFGPYQDIGNTERDKLIENLLKRVDELEEIKESIKTENDENNKMFAQETMSHQKSIDHLKTQLDILEKNNKYEIEEIKKRLDTFATKEDFNLYLRGSIHTLGKSRGVSNGRPSTAYTVNHVERYQAIDQQPPTVSFTMINGDNLTRPATAQVMRTHVTKRGRTRGYR